MVTAFQSGEGLDLPVDSTELSSAAVHAAEIVVVVAAVIVVNAAFKVGFRVLTRRAVRRALDGRGRWRLRLPRTGDGASVEQRRIQRADAAAHMLSRLSSLIVAGIAVLVISRILDVDPVVLISSAGFLGAGVAIGGQAVIKDWLTGLLVLLEDRYAIGDLVTMRVNGVEVTGTVETLGGAGVRLRLGDGTTWHTGHGMVESTTNLSQQLVTHTIEVPSDVWAELDETMVGRRLNAASHDLGLTDVLLVSDIDAQEADDGATTVTFRASRPLTPRQQRLVEQRITGRGPDSP